MWDTIGLNNGLETTKIYACIAEHLHTELAHQDQKIGRKLAAKQKLGHSLGDVNGGQLVTCGSHGELGDPLNGKRETIVVS